MCYTRQRSITRQESACLPIPEKTRDVQGAEKVPCLTRDRNPMPLSVNLGRLSNR